jgi:RNA-directed DNA polymerase
VKRHGNLWDKITHPDNLYKAYLKAKKGKGWRKSIIRFEQDIPGNLLKLQRSLCTHQFNTSSYSTKVIYEPKERTLYKLPFYPDRIVQHALLQVVIPIWDNIMIYDSYACRKGKGMHEASRKTMMHVKNYKYCFKADISKFYPSIVHDILLKIIALKIKCKNTLALLANIVRSFAGGKNTPIGNYTSQWFGNLYMTCVDYLVKHTFKIKAYIRYCDDFVLFHDCKKTLQSIRTKVQDYLASKLELKFSKSSVFPVTQGVDFLGYRHFPNKILLRKTTAKRAKRTTLSLPDKLLTGKITTDQFRSSIASMEGWMKWANTHNLRIHLNFLQLKKAYL